MDKLFATFDQTHVRIFRERFDVSRGQAALELLDAIEMTAASTQGLLSAPAAGGGTNVSALEPISSPGRIPLRQRRPDRLADAIAGFLDYVISGYPEATWSCAAGRNLQHLVFRRLDPETRDRLKQVIPMDLGDLPHA